VHIAILLSSNGKKEDEETERSVDRSSRSMCKKSIKRKKIYINKKKKGPPTQQGHKGKLLNSDEYPHTHIHHSKFPEMLYKKRKERGRQELIFLE